jgi:hypothetical protein
MAIEDLQITAQMLPFNAALILSRVTAGRGVRHY